MTIRIHQYDILGNKTAVTDPRGDGTDGTFTTWCVYDDLNRLYRTILPDETPPSDPYRDPSDNPYTETTYDATGNKVKERDANGVITSYEYTDRNWLLKVSDARGRVQTEYTYDKKGNQIAVKDISGHTTNKAYDSLGRLRKVTDPLSNEETYQYDAVGNKTAVTDARGNTAYYSYNALGWLTKVRNPLGNSGQYRYDPNGNRVETIAPNSLTAKTGYDELNRMVESLDSLGQATKYGYDLNGNREKVTDRRGTEWEYQYYANNLLRRVDATGADGTSYWAAYEYDAAGNRKEVTDSGNTIKYNFDGDTYQSDPLNRINNISRSFDGATYSTAYQYDQAGLVTGIKYPEATDWVEYGYNDLNQLAEVTNFTASSGISYNDDGSLKGISYANGAAAVYSYDANRHLDGLQVTLNGVDLLNLNYTYDAVGNIKTITDSGNIKTYEYDKNNQLTKAVTPGTFLETATTTGTASLKTGDILGNGVFEFTPILSGLMGLDYYASSIGIDFGSIAPGVKKIKLIPDADHTTHRIEENTIALYVSDDNISYTLIPKTSWKYQKDAQGVVTLTLNEKMATRYLKLHVKYDERDQDFAPVDKTTFMNEIAQMLRVYQESASRTEEYQYDAAGNRTLLKVTLVQTAEYTSQYYTNTDRLKTDGKYAFAYDNAGNVVKKGNSYEISGDTVSFTTTGEDVEYWEYQYDLLNRLIEVTKNGNIVSEYTYDPEGLRVVKKTQSETTHYVFQGTEPIFEKKIAAGTIKSYVYALGRYLARVDGVVGDSEAKKYYYHTDHLGSIRAVTDSSGSVVYKADYLAFGTKYDESGDFEELHGFTGKEYDPDTGLYYYNARWYDPDLGRFISEDPAADPNNPNLYSYCSNNPMIYNDPSGEFAFLVAALIGGIFGGIDAVCNGGDFWSGFFVGAVSGAIGYGFGEAFGTGILGSALAGGFTGGTMSVLMGGDFWDGARTGAISGGVSAWLGSKQTPIKGNNFLERVRIWFNNAFGELAGTGKYEFKASDALRLSGVTDSIVEALSVALSPPAIDEFEGENYSDADAYEMFEDLMADPAYWLAGPGGAIPDELYNAWREFQAYVGWLNNAVRGTKVGGHIIDWMTSDGRALEAKFVRIINQTKQLEAFAKIYGQKFELWISDYTQKISIPLLQVIQRNGGKIMRVIKGVPKEVKIDKLIKAGGALKNLKIFGLFPNPFYLPRVGDFSAYET